MHRNCALFFVLFLTCGLAAFGQQKVKDETVPGNGVLPNPDAILELESTNKGLLHTRVALTSSASASPLSQHVAGLMIYNTASENDVVPGIYYNDGTRWILARATASSSIQYDSSTHEITYIDQNGDNQIINLAGIVQDMQTVTLLVDNTDGTYTYYNESSVDEDGNIIAGSGVTINIPEVVINNFEDILSNGDVYNELVQLIRNEGGNAYFDGTAFTYIDGDGNTQAIDLSLLISFTETLTALDYDSATHTLTYTDENSDAAVIPLNAGSLSYDSATQTLTYTDERGGTQDVDLGAVVSAGETLTSLSYDSGMHALTYTGENGVPVVLPLNAGQPSYDSDSHTLTYTNEQGVQESLVLNTGSLSYDSSTQTLTYTDERGGTQDVDLGAVVSANETQTALDYDSVTHTLTYTDENGDAAVIPLNAGSLSYDSATQTLTYTDERGDTQDVDLGAVVLAGETLTSLSYDSGTHILTYTGENGVPVDLPLNAGQPSYDSDSHTLTYTNEQGNQESLVLNAGALGYDSSTNTLTYEDEYGDVVNYELHNTTNVTFEIDNDNLELTDSDGVTLSVPLTDFLAASSIQSLFDQFVLTADNGLLKTGTEIRLGGELTENTTIDTDGNTLAITGLQEGVDSDKLVVVDPSTGVLKTVNAAMPKFFYMPSAVFDVGAPSTGLKRNLYLEYISQFVNREFLPDPVTGGSLSASPTATFVGSAGAPDEIPHLLQATDLYYYITDYDSNVFSNLSIDAEGVLTYDVIGAATETSYMNIVLVIK